VFLIFLLAIFLITFIGSFLVRALRLDIDLIRMIAVRLFESLCVYRLILGYNHGMHNFSLKLIAMPLGGIPISFVWMTQDHKDPVAVAVEVAAANGGVEVNFTISIATRSGSQRANNPDRLEKGLP
jgi:hypothetical protein